MPQEWRIQAVTDHGADYAKAGVKLRYSAAFALERYIDVEILQQTKNRETGAVIETRTAFERRAIATFCSDLLWFTTEPDEAAIRAHPQFASLKAQLESAMAEALVKIPARDVTPADKLLKI